MYQNNGQLLICGNGGSSADSDHIVGELMKSFDKKRPLDDKFKQALSNVDSERGNYIAAKLEGGLPAIALTAHVGLISAVINDIDADLIFAQQVAGYGKNGDVLIAISTSGNSKNIVDACITAKAKGMKVIGLIGEKGGEMKQYCDVAICVPSSVTPIVQEFHLPVYHTICQVVEDELF
jgi:D-sedoheptulose 7-phosphate isomerase